MMLLCGERRMAEVPAWVLWDDERADVPEIQRIRSRISFPWLICRDKLLTRCQGRSKGERLSFLCLTF